MDKEERRTEKDEMLEHGGAGVYASDWAKQYLLSDPEWKHDSIPEIMDGANIADFVDPDIESKLAELEAEEEALLQGLEGERGMDVEDDEDEGSLDEEEEQEAKAIRAHKGKTVAVARIHESSNRCVLDHLYPIVNHSTSNRHLESLEYYLAF